MWPIFTLTRAVARKEFTLLVRYPVDSVSNIIMIYLLFALLFFGGQAVGGPTLAQSFDGIIVGFFLWTMASLSFAYLAWSVKAEAQWGTFEQLYMTPFGIRTVMAVKAIVGMTFNFAWGVLVLLLMLVTTSRSLHLDVVTIIPIGVFTLASAVGIGFAFAGFAVLYKRIGGLINLVDFVFVGLIAAPVGTYGWLKIVPLAQGSYLLRQTMEDGVRIWEYPAIELFILFMTAVFYLGAGYCIFWWAQRRARRKGILGHY